MYTSSFVVGLRDVKSPLAAGPLFPMDMLRYEGCFPQTSDDVNWMCDALDYQTIRDHNDIRITLVTRHSEKKPRLALARWESFGWTIVGEPVTRKC